MIVDGKSVPEKSNALRLVRIACVVASCLVSRLPTSADEPDAPGVLPKGRDGTSLNNDFESGDLRDWQAEGDAFSQQPVEGDRIAQRRSDMRSEHRGRFWIGGYEHVQDGGRGTLSSAPFKVTQPWAAFRVAGGGYDGCRV